MASSFCVWLLELDGPFWPALVLDVRPRLKQTRKKIFLHSDKKCSKIALFFSFFFYLLTVHRCECVRVCVQEKLNGVEEIEWKKRLKHFK